MQASRTTVILTLGACVLLPLLVGCASLSYVQEEMALRGLIHQAYKRTTPPALPAKYARHFQRGWRQAYYNISKGADPCPPSTPPEQYWSTKYQNREGSRMIGAWFEGYSEGVAAAQRDCRDLYSKVPVGAYCQRESARSCRPVERRSTKPDLELLPTVEDAELLHH